jgi:hypothetical protein
MQPSTNAIRVEEKLLSSRVVWPDPSMSPVVLDPWWRWSLRNLDLFDGAVGEKLDAISGVENLTQGLALLSKASTGGELLPITGSSVADKIPWEALERRFIDASLPYHPVRADETVATVPKDRPGPLRVALLVGHEGPGREFDRNQELDILKNAFNSSAQVGARIVSSSSIATLDLAVVRSDTERSAFFAETDPHVVFYFGHGKAGSNPLLRVGPGSSGWLPLEQIAAYASNKHPFPASWVFIACSIGESPSRETGPAGPEAFRILARCGARTMLAMRARIRPKIARIVAASLIESLSAGTPLELAAATARKTARRARENENLTLIDWAAPAVWSTVVGRMPPQGAAIPPGFVAAKLTRAAADDPGVGLGAPDDSDGEVARRWSEERRIRLDVSTEDEASIAARLSKISAAIGAVSGRTSLFVRVKGGGSFTARMADWAGSVLPALNLSERETSLGKAVRRLVDHDLEGLESILGIPGAAVIFSSPPGRSDATAWDLIEGAGTDTTIVIGYSSVNQEFRDGWTPDRIKDEGAMQNAIDALRRYPETIALLSVLDGPANLGALSAITEEPIAAPVTAGLTISMPSGVVLTASARNAIRANLDAEIIKNAHRRAFEARRSIPALIESDDNFAAVRDLVGADAPELIVFVNALAAKWSDTWTEADWISLAYALEQARNRWSGLESWVLLKIANVLVARQTLRQAELWLDALETDDPELDAERQYLLSEVAKAGGTTKSQERMWKLARRALTRLEEAIAAKPNDTSLSAKYRDMRANLARLELYFNGDAEAARVILAAIVNELNGQPEAEVAGSIVATLRNLAECLFEFEPFRWSTEQRKEARSHLVRAALVAQRYELMALHAEAMYSAAKLDEGDKDWAAARDHLAATIESARSSGHAVCLRIAEMRVFWLNVHHEDGAFDFALFTARLRKLEVLESHAWAKRYAAQSRLWAARELDRSEDQAGMRVLLDRNIISFGPLQHLASNSDRRFIALSYAGLAFSEAATAQGEGIDQESWKVFMALDWAPKWVKDNNTDKPSEYWRRDT